MAECHLSQWMIIKKDHSEVVIIEIEIPLKVSFYVCFRPNKIKVEVPEIECEDETKITPLSVTFLQGQGEYLDFN